MRHDILAKELVRALRGARSQGSTNRRLGRSSNVAHAWERGTRQPRASDFFKLARLARVDVEAMLNRFAPFEAATETRAARALTAWLVALTRGRSQLELARGVGRD